MGNIIAERVKDAKLTKAQRKIAEYFIQNQDRIGSLSSLDVAKEIGVSDASIIRFSRAIGYEGYADLKASIYHMLVENAHGGLSLSERLSKNTEKYSSANSAIQFQHLMQQNLNSVFKDNKLEDFDRTAKLLVDAKNRYVIGMRGCRGVAVQFGRLLTFMLPHVHTLTDGECSSISSLQDITKNDVLLMFVYSRFYKVDLSFVELAHERGAKICIVTDNITGPLSAYADIVLIVSSSNMSFYHSTVGVDVVGEYILNLISTQVDFKARIEERDRITGPQRL